MTSVTPVQRFGGCPCRQREKLQPVGDAGLGVDGGKRVALGVLANTTTASDDLFLLAQESVGLSAYSINWFYEGGKTSSAGFEIMLPGSVNPHAGDLLL